LDTSKCVSWQNKGLIWLCNVDMFVASSCKALRASIPAFVNACRISSIPT